MEELKSGIGQAVFLRTDTPDCCEETIPFRSLEELVSICSVAHPNLTLERILVHAMARGEPCSLTLGYLAATCPHRPNTLLALNKS